MDLKAYKIFNDNIVTLKETSKDDASGEFMTESQLKVINFDKVKREYTNSFSSSEDAATSVDAILQKNDNVVFIEFKNGRINDNTRKNIKRKVSDTLLIFNDIVGMDLSARRTDTEFILVYNSEKNISHEDIDEDEVQESVSKNKIVDHISKKAKKEIVRFKLEPYKGLYFKDVHTYSNERFEEYLKKL